MHDPEEEANHMLGYAVFLEARVVGTARVSSCSLHSSAAVVGEMPMLVHERGA